MAAVVAYSVSSIVDPDRSHSGEFRNSGLGPFHWFVYRFRPLSGVRGTFVDSVVLQLLPKDEISNAD